MINTLLFAYNFKDNLLLHQITASRKLNKLTRFIEHTLHTLNQNQNKAYIHEYLVITHSSQVRNETSCTCRELFRTGVKSLRTGVESFSTGVKPLCTGVKSLLTGAETFRTGIKSLLTGAETFCTVVKPLLTGVETFRTGIKPLLTGAETLITGYNSNATRLKSFKTINKKNNF